VSKKSLALIQGAAILATRLNVGCHNVSDFSLCHIFSAFYFKFSDFMSEKNYTTSTQRGIIFYHLHEKMTIHRPHGVIFSDIKSEQKWHNVSPTFLKTNDQKWRSVDRHNVVLRIDMKLEKYTQRRLICQDDIHSEKKGNNVGPTQNHFWKTNNCRPIVTIKVLSTLCHF
jgi:hypothetical protein